MRRRTFLKLPALIPAIKELLSPTVNRPMDWLNKADIGTTSGVYTLDPFQMQVRESLGTGIRNTEVVGDTLHVDTRSTQLD